MIVCAKCNLIMRPKKNGVAFVEMAQAVPYKLWMADLWECPECHAEVLHTSPLQKPVAELYEDKFAAAMQTYQPKYQARDCN